MSCNSLSPAARFIREQSRQGREGAKDDKEKSEPLITLIK